MTASRTRAYLAGLATGYLVTIVTVVVGLWLTPFTLRYLSREQYAVFTLAGDVLMWLGLLDLGITAGMSVQAAQMTGTPDQEKLNRLASTGFFSQAVISLSMLVIGVGLAVGFPRFFSLSPEIATQSTWMFFLLVLGSALQMGMQTFSGLLVAHQQIYVDNIIRLILIFLRTFLTVLLLVLGWGMLSLAIANLAAIAVTSLLAVARVYRLLPGLKIRTRYFSMDWLRSTASLGIWFSLGSVAGILITSMDRIVTAKLLDITLVTTLSLTGRLYALMGGMLQQITSTARPMLGQLLGQKKLGDVLRIYRNLFAISTGGAVVAGASIWAGNASFVRWWVGPVNYGGTMLDVALVLNMVMHAWVLPNRATLSAGLIVRPQTLCRLLEGAINIVLSVALAKWLGVFGVLIATTIAGITTSVWYLPYLTARMFERPYIRFIWEDMRRILALMICLIPIAIFARRYAISLGGLPGFLFGFICVGAIGMALLWFVVFDDGLRKQVLLVLYKTRSAIFSNV